MNFNQVLSGIKLWPDFRVKHPALTLYCQLIELLLLVKQEVKVQSKKVLLSPFI